MDRASIEAARVQLQMETIKNLLMDKRVKMDIDGFMWTWYINCTTNIADTLSDIAREYREYLIKEEVKKDLKK